MKRDRVSRIIILTLLLITFLLGIIFAFLNKNITGFLIYYVYVEFLCSSVFISNINIQVFFWLIFYFLLLVFFIVCLKKYDKKLLAIIPIGLIIIKIISLIYSAIYWNSFCSSLDIVIKKLV
jgi:hypothetical protein